MGGAVSMSRPAEILCRGDTSPPLRTLSWPSRMPKATARVVVFLDIDSAGPARGVSRDRLAAILEALAARRITLVFCTHGTRAEVESHQQALGVFHPFICENGAAIFVPDRYFGSAVEHTRRVGGYQAIEFGRPYGEVCEKVSRIADRMHVGILGFHDMSVEQVARECSLSLLDARLAKLREYGEPFRLLYANPMGERRLLKALETVGIRCAAHGPFRHAGTVDGPARAAAALTSLYRAALGPVVTASAGTRQDTAAAFAADFRLTSDSAQALSGGAVAWFESIVEEIDTIRDVALSGLEARHAR